jgi:hypothetical protein
LQGLGDLYKQLDAPYGAFDQWLLTASTNGIKADDATYLRTETEIETLTAQRDALVRQIRGVLSGGQHGYRARAAGGAARSTGQLMGHGRTLLVRMAALAGMK